MRRIYCLPLPLSTGSGAIDNAIAKLRLRA